jgi:hypothetical protein
MARQFVIAPVYVVGMAVTQNSCVPLPGQSVSEVHPAGLQKPDEQMLEGGPQLLSLSQAIWQVCVAIAHCARGLLSDWMQSASAVQPVGAQRCVVPSQVLPAAQSRSCAHLK